MNYYKKARPKSAAYLLPTTVLGQARRDPGRICADGQAFLSRRRHPGSDLGAGIEAELVHDVADVGGHRPVGDE
jgi:hypothetical protein